MDANLIKQRVILFLRAAFAGLCFLYIALSFVEYFESRSILWSLIATRDVRDYAYMQHDDHSVVILWMLQQSLVFALGWIALPKK